MAKVSVYNKEGKKAADMDVSDAVFGAAINPTLVHQVYLALEANARQPWAHAKDKSDVRGGGRKPWRQKGTGRARHGSIRSPLWRGGGATFGPLSKRNYKQSINKKMNQSAVRMCLTSKLGEEKLMVLEDIVKTGKTKDMATLRNALPGSGKSTLILMDATDEHVGLASRNIPRLNVQRAQDVNVADLLHHQYVIATKEAVKVLEDRLA